MLYILKFKNEKKPYFINSDKTRVLVIDKVFYFEKLLASGILNSILVQGLLDLALKKEDVVL